MKIHYNLSLPVLAMGVGAFLGSCTDLEPEPLGITVEETVGSELPVPADPEAALISAYNLLRLTINQTSVFALSEHTSDELIGPTRGTDWSDYGVWRQLHAHTWDNTNARILETFNLLTRGYFGATQVVAATDDLELQGRAKFLRAFFMTSMVDFFGQVPFREATEGFGTTPKVLTRSEATALVIEDLEAAVASLPDFSGNTGEITKQAAESLLARVYLNRSVFLSDDPSTGTFAFPAEDMQRVVDLADEVIGSGSFELQAPGTYFKQFAKDNTAEGTEAIFALNFSNGDQIGESVEARYRMTTHYNQELSGWNGFTTIADFYNRWDQDDERFRAEPLDSSTGFTAGFQEGQQFGKDSSGVLFPLNDRNGNPLVFTTDVDLSFSTEAQGVRVIKYYPDFANAGDPGNDFVFLRLADVILMKAEALLRLGDSDGALNAVNDLRASRAGIEPLASIDEKAILDERGFEMYWEGVRRTDQIRFGTFRSPYTEKDYESDPRVVLFPIPQQQLDVNPGLQQNPGY